jgi:hypothetical protein
MIRIDEIYNNTFWPWFSLNRPGTRVFFCDPPGRTDPNALFNLGSDDIAENDFIYFHDQEPVHLSIFEPLFDEVKTRNLDLQYPKADEYKFSGITGHVVVSERGEYVDALCKRYGWTPHYYFYHGWACADWFRGYDRTFLIPRAQLRMPTKTFMSPNRIVGGQRDHRVLFLYNVFKNQLEQNHISAPRVCPAEGVDITSIAQKYTNVYQDISRVLDQAKLPMTFDGEDTQEMTSCWLGNYAEAQDSLVYVPTETVYFGNRTHLTEKTFKAIALEMPFVLVAPAGSLEYLKEYGFKTFSNIFNESYDTETDDLKRIEQVVSLLKELDNLSIKQRQEIHRACLPIVEHNYHHFYRGAFADQLWTELNQMLNEFTN